MEKHRKKNTYIYIHTYIYKYIEPESLCCKPELQHCKPTVLQFKKQTKQK